MESLVRPPEKFYRILFHVLIISVLFLIPAFYGPERMDPGSTQIFWNGRMVMRILSIPLYFVNVFFFIPQYLIRGKYAWYTITVLAGALTTLIVLEIIIVNNPSLQMQPRILPEVLNGKVLVIRPVPPKTFALHLPMMLPLIFHLAIGTSFEMVLYWQAQKKEREKVEKDKIFTELSFLKSQINPHFLFNTLNNIYSLAEKQSDKTGEAVLMLSSLMRYMLYESNGGKIALQKEIQYLKNYINIQRLRISSEVNATVNFTVMGDDTGIIIEPLILITFVENAFKHGMSYSQKSAINITLTINRPESKFTLHVFNTKKSLIQETAKPGSEIGIGLMNSKRRLEILYPNTHELQITDGLDFFEVRLTLWY